MTKSSRNRLCPCGSGKKHKKCCLYRGTELPIKERQKPANKILIKTLTGEIFQPIRLYYKVHENDKLKACLQQLKCIEYNVNLEIWILKYDEEATDICLNIPRNKVPVEARPLILAKIYIEDETMLIDLRSFERAARIIEFLNQYISREITEVTHGAIYNRLISVTAKNIQAVRDIDYDEIFSENRMKIIDPDKHILELKALVSRYGNEKGAREAAFKTIEEAAKQPLPEVEKFPLYFYEEGTSGFETACGSRQAIAMQHYLGKKDYSFYDLIHGIVPEGATPK